MAATSTVMSSAMSCSQRSSSSSLSSRRISSSKRSIVSLKNRKHASSKSSYSRKETVVVSASSAKIKVVGCGGGGGNAVNRMIEAGVSGVDFWVVNTDAQALVNAQTVNVCQIGEQVTRGLGCGGNPELGEVAANESRDKLNEIVKGSDLVFITAGMGGGTGSGSAPVVARMSKEAGNLTVGVVTYPFSLKVEDVSYKQLKQLMR